MAPTPPDRSIEWTIGESRGWFGCRRVDRWSIRMSRYADRRNHRPADGSNLHWRDSDRPHLDCNPGHARTRETPVWCNPSLVHQCGFTGTSHMGIVSKLALRKPADFLTIRTWIGHGDARCTVKETNRSETRHRLASQLSKGISEQMAADRRSSRGCARTFASRNDKDHRRWHFICAPCTNLDWGRCPLEKS